MKELLQTLGTWKFWKELIIMTVAMLIAAAAVYYFLMPSNLVIGRDHHQRRVAGDGLADDRP